MKQDIKYYKSRDWHIKSSPGKKPYLENAKGGKISLDKTGKKLLETIDGHTFDQLDQAKIISTGMLDIFLKVFVQVGVLKEENDRGESQSSGPARSREDHPQVSLVSIVIVNYNGDKHLPDLLESLKRQTYKNFEIIVVDNNSSDNSCQWLKTHHSDILLMELPKNIGFAAAINTGIGRAGGDYILVLNNDIVLDERALAELVKAVTHRDTPWAAAAPKMKFFNNPAFINAIGNSLYPIAWGSDNFIGYVDFGQFDHFPESFSACFGAVLLNPEVIKTIGPLDRHYKFYYEDMDWSFRAQVHGYPVITAPKAEIYHKFGASMSLKSRAFKARYIVGNRLRFTLKNLDRQTRKRFLAKYLFEDLRSTLFYLKNRDFSMVLAYIRGYLKLLFSLPVIFSQRRKLQKSRKIIDDRLIFAKAAPVNFTTMENGAPKLDIYSLRNNYAFLTTSKNLAVPDTTFGETPGEFFTWQFQPPRETKKSLKKIYVEFIFYLAESGYYDIHLEGVVKRNVTIYLDDQPVARHVFIPAGNHLLRLGRRSRVQAIVLKKST